jgi:hypothetical protein
MKCTTSERTLVVQHNSILQLLLTVRLLQMLLLRFGVLLYKVM